MQLHQARRANLSNKKKVRVGRGPGSGLGKTAGRGIKGATSRSGYAMKVTYEGGQMPIFRRLPKRGFRNGRFKVTFVVINVGDLSVFPAGSSVGIQELRDKGLAYGTKGTPIKVLGEGELTVKLLVTADAFSKSAIEKIVKAGGTATWIDGAPKKKAPNFKRIDAEKKQAEKSKAAAAKPEAKAAEGKPAEAKAPAPAEGKPAKAEHKADDAKAAAHAEGKAEHKAEHAKAPGKADHKGDEAKAPAKADDAKAPVKAEHKAEDAKASNKHDAPTGEHKAEVAKAAKGHTGGKGKAGDVPEKH